MQTWDGGYDVSVELPAGGGKEHIKLPFTVPEVLGKIREMSGTVRGAATRKAEFGGVENLVMICLLREWRPNLRGGLAAVLQERR